MDIGNYPIYSNTDKPQKSRSFDGVPEPKNPWDQIGDYEQGPATGNNTNDDDDEEDDKKPAQPEPPKKTATQKEKQESDDAASIASQAAVKESHKNQS